MLNVGMPTGEFFEKVKKAAIGYFEIPPMAEYEIRFSSQSPENSEEKQVLDQVVTGSGPMLVVELTD
jgi:hypothetical protein